MEFLRPGEGLCPSKLGEKRIYDLVVGDKVLKGGAWSYEEELAPKAERFRGMIGFLDEAPLMLILKKLPLTYGMLLTLLAFCCKMLTCLFAAPVQPSRQIETIHEGDEGEDG